MTVGDDKILSTEEAWDSRELGADERFVRSVEMDDETEAALNAALELKPISIRLPASLIEDYKAISSLMGMGYQPLMRKVLARFAEAEKRKLMNQFISEEFKRAREDVEEDCDEPEKQSACG